MNQPPRVSTHQLYVVDAFLGELLQGSFGRLLQWESEALKCLVLTLHADLCLHLQGAASTHTSLLMELQIVFNGIIQLYI